MSGIADVFTELFFGEGKWLGLILVVSFILVMCWRKREAAFIFLPITILMGLEYLETVSFSDPFFYGALTLMFMPLFIIADFVRGKV